MCLQFVWGVYVICLYFWAICLCLFCRDVCICKSMSSVSDSGSVISGKSSFRFKSLDRHIFGTMPNLSDLHRCEGIGPTIRKPFTKSMATRVLLSVTSDRHFYPLSFYPPNYDGTHTPTHTHRHTHTFP
jgi:hypothetical protein